MEHTAPNRRDNTVSTANNKDDSSMDDNNSNGSPQPAKNPTCTSTEIEHLHLHDDTIVLQACPSVNGIFCDSVNAIAEILSIDGEDDGLQEAAQKARRDSQCQPIPVGPKACLTPTSEHGCQRRGRFLVWPVSLSTPSLNLPETRGHA